ncbi:TldD/PmbA family protein [Clostridium sp. P21]|uniref:TldD/PmbA family protein n=1 Tax=Clostridium muellerianum TaxID=2716538 RepID=A0A7Y0EJ99_9CLOT|nr:TldD/PmbA family protein [Clostridium muellerianum]NMM64494.1 TldD/PmbA family protein [Clostridium muellerianum]
MNILEFQKSLFEKGKQQGFIDMEIFYSTNKSNFVNVSQNKISSYVVNENGGVSFRGIFNNTMGYSYTEKLDDESIDFLIKEAKENAVIIELDEQYELYDGAEDYNSINNYSKNISSIEPQKLIEAAFQMESIALNSDSRIKNVIEAGISKFESEVAIINTKGLNCHSKYTSVSAWVYLMANDRNQTTTGYYDDFSLRDFSELDLKRIAEKAAREATLKLGADSIESGNYPVIFRHDTASELLDIIISNLSGEAVEKGFSKLKGRLGEKIAGDNITIIEDPLMKNVPGAAAFDAEGYPTRKIELIRDGKLLSFLHNRKTAKNSGTESTGNAVKNGYRSTISVGPHNVYLKPGKQSVENIISSMQNGIYIVELQGTNVGINYVSGDFSLYAIGFLIERGRIGRCINQITVSGNMFDLINNIEEIGDDINFKGSVSSASVKVNNLTISGS